jgi:alpha-L-rhamnosidase
MARFLGVVVWPITLCCLAGLMSNAFCQTISERILTARWEADWCAHPDGPAHEPAVFLFRNNFDIESVPDRFIIHVSADQRYQLYVNGERIAFGPARGDPLHWRFETLDIAPHLKRGKNIAAAYVWSFGDMAPWAQMGVYTAFIVQGDGERERVLNTPGNWRCCLDRAWEVYPPNKRAIPFFCVVGPGERIVSDRHPWGWLDIDFDDSSWAQPVRVGGGCPFGIRDGGSLWQLVPRSIPLMEETRERIPAVARAVNVDVPAAFLEGRAPVTVPPRTKATILMDRRELTCAYPEIVVSAGAGATIRATYAEALWKNREKGNRDEVEEREIRGYYDEFLPDGGQNRCFSPLWWRTFRYLQLDIETKDQPLTLEDFRVVYTGYPFEQRAEFSASDGSLKDIWDVGWHTARLCAGETYFDCPYYEQLQYVGDTRIQALVSLYVAGDDRLVRNAIELFNESRMPEGLTQSRYPSRILQVIPPFSLFWIGMIHDYWRHRDDDDFVRKYVPGVRGVLGWFEQHRTADGMLGGLPWWNFADWCGPWRSGVPPGADTEGSSIVTLQYVMALREAADLEDALGSAEQADLLRARADEIVRAVREACWDDARGLLADTPEKESFSQHASLLAVLTDLVPADRQKEVMERVLSDESLTQCTFYFRYYLHRAAKKAGLGDRYVSFLEPWRKMLELGLTTWAETPEPTRSDCHAWSASPNYEFLATVCGIEPAANCFSRVRIEPHLGDLDWVKGRMPHPKGIIGVTVRRMRDGITAEVELPPDLPGIFVWRGHERILGAGKQRVEIVHKGE